jgi:uncharacterized protein (TIGR00251 family)
MLGDELKIALTAPPVDGKANLALLKFLARQLGLKNSQLTLRSGTASRSKVVAIEGMPLEEILSRLGAVPGGAAGGPSGETGGEKKEGKTEGKKADRKTDRKAGAGGKRK